MANDELLKSIEDLKNKVNESSIPKWILIAEKILIPVLLGLGTLIIAFSGVVVSCNSINLNKSISQRDSIMKSYEMDLKIIEIFIAKITGDSISQAQAISLISMMNKKLGDSLKHKVQNNSSLPLGTRVQAFEGDDPKITSKLGVKNNWVIMGSADTELNQSKYELQRIQKKYPNAYIFKRENKRRGTYYFVVVVDSFDSQETANVALNKIKNEVNKTAYVFDISTWCTDMVDRGDVKVCEPNDTKK